ncbi:MAG: hypothetical protein KKA65_02155 [Nanoarchaeota archaeon]|nr:hypothetical protein [Nanoarchaeota archaeon]MBU4241900.1 hypothetical protein [Nanoarchaeota archaeon]MBU4352516.1 hypothetical protein [Nanoarchaeota archaeon]MBU4456279.1 hypothetical protein [Nanoarchaeota archaeon]MCG2720260.1 hypothetical protein [Nanoarchaeota archaeon]
MKKGQLLSQPFIYIFALILGALILVWGVKTVMDLRETSELVELGTFVKDMESEVNKYFFYDEGAARNFDLRLPDKIKYMCIINPETFDRNKKCIIKSKTGELSERDCNTIEDSLTLKLVANSNNKNNIQFLPTTAARISKFKIEHLIPEKNDQALCIINAGKMKIVSKVSHVEAS